MGIFGVPATLARDGAFFSGTLILAGFLFGGLKRGQTVYLGGIVVNRLFFLRIVFFELYVDIEIFSQDSSAARV